jgi:hypothetical protein
MRQTTAVSLPLYFDIVTPMFARLEICREARDTERDKTEMTIYVRKMLYTVRIIQRLMRSSSDELVSDKYAVHAIPTVETKGCNNISGRQVARYEGGLTIWN